MGALFHILKTDPMSQAIPLRCNGALPPCPKVSSGCCLSPLSVHTADIPTTTLLYICGLSWLPIIVCPSHFVVSIERKPFLMHIPCACPDPTLISIISQRGKAERHSFL